MATPWADALAKRTAESKDLLPSSDPVPKPPVLPAAPIVGRLRDTEEGVRPMMDPTALGPPAPVPSGTPFIDRILQAGGAVKDYLASSPEALVKNIAGIREDPIVRSLVGEIPYSKAFRQLPVGYNVFQEAVINRFPEIATAFSDPFAWENIKRNPIIPGGLQRLVTEDPMGYLSSRPEEFMQRLEQNRAASSASQELIGQLMQGGMSFEEATLALSDIFESRPMSTQLATSFIDPIAVPGAVRGGIRAARAGLPAISRNAPGMLRSQVAHAAPASRVPPIEPWRMTSDEFLSANAGRGRTDEALMAEHERSVSEAISGGLPVPEPVLLQYPTEVMRGRLAREAAAGQAELGFQDIPVEPITPVPQPVVPDLPPVVTQAPEVAPVPRIVPAAPTPAVAGDEAFRSVLDQTNTSERSTKFKEDIVEAGKIRGGRGFNVKHTLVRKEAHQRLYDIEDTLGRPLTRSELDELEVSISIDGDMRRLADKPHPWFLNDNQTSLYNTRSRFPYRDLEEVAPTAAPPTPPAPTPGVVPAAAIPTEVVPLRFDPQTNRYNGDELLPGTLLTDDAGITYKVNRRLGFMLSLDQLKPDGSLARTISYSVDQTDRSRYKALYKSDIPSPAVAIPERVAAAVPTPVEEAVDPRVAVTPEIGPRIGDKQSVGPRSSMTTLRAVETVDPNVRYELYIADEGQPDHMIRVIDGDTGEAVSIKTYPTVDTPESERWSMMRIEALFNHEVTAARRGEVPITPTQAVPLEVDPELQSIVNKWETRTQRNSTLATNDLNRLKESGFEVSDAEDKLATYIDTQSTDFPGDPDDFSEAKTAAWDDFVASLSDIEAPEIPVAGAIPVAEVPPATGTAIEEGQDSVAAAIDDLAAARQANAPREQRIEAEVNIQSNEKDLLEAHIASGKSYDAAKEAADAPIPDRTLKTTVKDPSVRHSLPQNLRSSRPQYRDQSIEFEDDLDKALYIVAAQKASKAEPAFLAWINDVTGMSNSEAKVHGRLIRAEIKKLYTGVAEDTIHLRSTVDRAPEPPPTVTSIPNQPTVQILDDTTIGGVDSFLSDSHDVGGFRYQLYTTKKETTDPRATVRVINEITGSIESETQLDNIDEATNLYDQMVHRAYVGDAGPIGPSTQGGPSGTLPPEGPPLVNASGEPYYDDPDDALGWFRRFLADPSRAVDWALTQEWRRESLSTRVMTQKEYMGQLIAGGMEEGQAAIKSREVLRGPLPRPETPLGLHEIALAKVRTALENKVAQYWGTQGQDDYLEMNATMKALQNALDSKAIPNKPLTPGGQTAFTRLQRVFGDEIVEGLDIPQDIETIISTRIRTKASRRAGSKEPLAPGTFPPDRPWPYPPETAIPTQPPLSLELPGPGRAGIPDTRNKAQKARDLILFMVNLRKQYSAGDMRPDRPWPYPEEAALRPGQVPLYPERPGPDLGATSDRRTAAEKSRAVQELTISLYKKYAPRFLPRASHPPGDIPPETWIRQFELMPDPDRHLLISTAKEAGLTSIDLGNFLKANLASVDFSFWRQQAPLIFGNPMAFTRGNIDAFKAIWSEDYAKKVMSDIESSPWMQYYDSLGIDFLRPLDTKVPTRVRGGTIVDQTGRRVDPQGAEEFGLFAGERPIQRLTRSLPWVRISSRAHITGTNAMNWKIFTTFMEQQQKVSRGIARGDIIMKPGEKTFDLAKEAKAMGSMLEDMSGRAQLPEALTKLTPAMNAGFFSMRLNIGRLIMGRHLLSKSPTVRKIAFKNLVTSVVGFSAVILAGKQMGLWDVETDSRSSDFMVIRIGKIRIDPWGGARQYVTFFSRMMTIAAAMETLNIPGAGRFPQGGLKSTTTGEIIQSYGSTTARMIRSKAAPLATLVMDTFTGKDFLGDPVDNTDISQWAERIAPLAVQDIYEAFQEQGGWSASSSAAAILGAGVIVYDLPRWQDLDEYYMIKGIGKQSTSSRRSAYRKRHPLQEARLFVRGDISTLSSPKSRMLVYDIMSEHNVDPEDVPGYEKIFKNRPVPEGRSVSDADEQNLKITQERYAPMRKAQEEKEAATQKARDERKRVVKAQPSRQPTPVFRLPSDPGPGEVTIRQIFDAFPSAGREEAYGGLIEAWFSSGQLTPSQQIYLQDIFQKFPLGQTNFNVWLRQTLRQRFESGRHLLE